jgi:manganese oxidase
MANRRFTRRQALAGAAPALAAIPMAGLAAAPRLGRAASPDPPGGPAAGDHAAMGHAAMVGDAVPAPGGPTDLDDLLTPPPALAHQPGRVRRYSLVALDRDVEVAKGVTFPAWTYNGTVPGPVIRATQDDILEVEFRNAGTHPHTIHFHGIHPSDMDGVFEVVAPGGAFTYRFPAKPYGMHLYHCHAPPLKKHIHKGLYGAFIIDPPAPRRPAREIVLVMNGFDTDGDGENNFYAVNGRAFYYARYPIRVRRSQTLRIYIANLTEFDPINSFHLHGEFFRYYRTGSTDQFEYTDTVMQCQGERGIIEIDWSNAGRFMFHAHQSEFTDLGWMGFFDVVDD